MAAFSTAAVRLLLGLLVAAGVSGAIFIAVRANNSDSKAGVIGQLTETVTPVTSETPPLPATTEPAATGTPTTPSAAVTHKGCGDWSNQYVSGTAGFAIAGQYGEFHTCELFGDTWVIPTAGKIGGDGVRGGGVIALYSCNSDQACLDNQTYHPFAGWEFVSPPYPGSISILRVVDDETLEISVGNAQGGRGFRFDVVTRAFADVMPATPALEVTPASAGR